MMDTSILGSPKEMCHITVRDTFELANKKDYYSKGKNSSRAEGTFELIFSDGKIEHKSVSFEEDEIKGRKSSIDSIKSIRNLIEKKELKFIPECNHALFFSTSFILFISDCFSVLEQSKSLNNQNKILNEIIFAFFESSSHEKKKFDVNKFNASCIDLFEKLENTSPLYPEIKEKFDRWVELINKFPNMVWHRVAELSDIVSLPIKHFGERVQSMQQRVKDRKPIRPERFSLSVRRKDTKIVADTLLDLLLNLLTQISEQAPDWIEEAYANNGLANESVSAPPKKELLYKPIKKINEIIRLLKNEQINNVIDKISEDNFEYKNKYIFSVFNDRDFSQFSSQAGWTAHMETWERQLEGEEPPQLNKSPTSYEELKQMMYSCPDLDAPPQVKAQKLMEVKASLKIHRLALKIYQIFLGMLLMVDDLGFYNQALSAKSSGDVGQRFDFSGKGRGKKGKNKKGKTQQKRVSKSQQPQGRRKPVEPPKQVTKEPTMSSPTPSSSSSSPPQPVVIQKLLLGAASPQDAERRLIRALIPVGWQELSQYLVNAELESMLKRLSAASLHGLLEKSLTLLRSDGELLTHNLWQLARRRNRVDQRVLLRDNQDRKLMERLHLGIHFARFTKQYMSFYERQISLRGEKQDASYRLLSHITNKSSAAENKFWNTLTRDSVSYHDRHFDLLPQTSNSFTSGVVDLSKEAELLRNLQTDLKDTVDSTLWIAQWKQDIVDLRATFQLLQSDLKPEAFVLLFAHSLSLLHSSIQSPLYHLLEQTQGRSRDDHRLSLLMKEANVSFSEKQNQLIEEELKGLSTVHRYPFKHAAPQSNLHHSLLEAIAWYLEPFEGDALVTPNVNQEKSWCQQTGTPYLEKRRAPVELRQAYGKTVQQAIELIIKPLIQHVKRTVIPK